LPPSSSSSSSSYYSNNKKKKILFIDDEPDMTSLFRMVLEDAGFNVYTFNDPVLALNRFQPNFYQLVLLDIVMPNMDGFELYKQLKNVDPNVKICFLTAAEKYREKLRKEEEYCALDKSLFIHKPISNEDLAREINKRINSG
jgi:CheY-like chemotaxis protein